MNVKISKLVKNIEEGFRFSRGDDLSFFPTAFRRVARRGGRTSKTFLRQSYGYKPF